MSSVVYGLVLAGGDSRRMGDDKAALNYVGEPQLQRAYALLQSHCTQTFVSVRADQQHESLRARWPLLLDSHPQAGPLAGIAAAQAAHPEVAWLVIACDLPLLTPRTLMQLLQQRDATRLATAYRSPHDQGAEPLCTIWEAASAAPIRSAIAANKLSPRTLLQSWNTLLINATEPQALTNVNTRNEHQQAQAALAQTEPQVQVQYFALLREQAGRNREIVHSRAGTPAQLYDELQQRHAFTLGRAQLKVAINNAFCDWQTALRPGDVVTFIPPVAGG